MAQAPLQQPPDLDALVAAAERARQNAYCPYSHFAVGAAALFASGHTYIGANVENASFPASRCAEQAALLAGISAGEAEVQALVVVTDSSPPATPCGVCRQILVEHGPSAWVVAANLEGQRRSFKIHDLLPHHFHLEAQEESAPDHAAAAGEAPGGDATQPARQTGGGSAGRKPPP